MENNDRKDLPDVKEENKDKKDKADTAKKKIIVIVGAVVAVAVLAAIVVALVLGGAQKPAHSDDTGAVRTDVGGSSEKPNGDAPSTDKTDLPASNDTSDSAKPQDSNAQTDPTGTDPATDPDDTAETSSLVIEVDPYDTDPIVEDTTVIVVEPGKTAADWPDELPDAIPAFKGELSFNNNCSYEVFENQDIWYMAWDTNQADYDAWMLEIQSAGFKNNDAVAAYWANGEYVLDIITEDIEGGGLWVSMDVYHTHDVVFPEAIAAAVPKFETEGTLEYWYDDPNERVIRMHYVNVPEWKAELDEYRIMLRDLGFTMTPDYASMTVNGTEFSIHWDSEYCRGEHMLAIKY